VESNVSDLTNLTKDIEAVFLNHLMILIMRGAKSGCDNLVRMGR
jgi:hypothetical protein